MIKFDKNSWFVSYIVCFLFIFNLVLSFRIPFVLPILGLIALCFIPGFLFCLLFGIKVVDIYENFLYSVGISIIFDLLFGLLVNTLLPLFGINDPLSSQNLQICFSVSVLIITACIIYTDKTPVISFKFPEILNIEKIFLAIGFIIVIYIEAGIYLINIENNNFFLIISIFLIPLLLFFLIIYHNDSIRRIYPFIIYLISFSLLMLFALRSNYILGYDSNPEYNLFHTTLSQSIWILNPSSLLSAALSISIVPTVFEIFFNTNPQLLFKVLYPLIFSITPVIIYVIAKKYVNELLALFASCFFMFEYNFITTSANSRTSLAIFFFAFAVLVLCNKELSNIKKYAMLLLFIPGSIFSHYTTSLIFFGIFFFVYLMDIALSRFESRRENQPVNLPLLIFFISAIFFWYGQINDLSATGIRFLSLRLNIFNDLIGKDVSKYIYPSLKMSSSLWYFIKISQAIIFVLIGIGVLFAIYSWVQKTIQKKSVPRFFVSIDRTLFLMGIVTLGILVGITFAPFMFFGYDTGRTLELILVVLSVFLIIGACNFFSLIFGNKNYFKTHQNKIVSGILLVLLVPHLLFATGISYQFDGIPYSIILNSPKNSKTMDYGYVYIYDQDAMALQWVKANSPREGHIISDDYGKSKIASQLNAPYIRSIAGFDQPEDTLLRGYIFITVINDYHQTFKSFNWNETKINTIEPILSQKNKIYSNGAVLYR